MKLWMNIPADWRRPNEPQSYQLYWRQSSGYGVLHPRPARQDVAAFYVVDDYYTHSEAMATTQANLSLADKARVHLAWRTDRSAKIDDRWLTTHLKADSAKILDIGCGKGELMRRLMGQGHQAWGVEPDPVSRQIALDRGLMVFAGEAEQLPAEIIQNRYNAIFMIHVLEHCIDPLAALRNCFNLLEAGGSIILETPNNAAAGLQTAGIAWRWLDVPRHLNFFTAQSLANICALAGFDLVKTEYRGYARQFLPDWIQEEQRIWDCYNAKSNGAFQMPPRNANLQNWRLLIKTMFASDDKKYDSVRIIGRKP